jgi:hypothetical protein
MQDALAKVDFEGLGNTTRLTLTHEVFDKKEDASDHNEGGSSANKKFARLSEQNKISA